VSGVKRTLRSVQRLVDRDTGLVVVERLELATTFGQRFWGWQFRAVPPAGTGVLIAPCNSVHTFGMRFAIDVAYLAEDGRILSVRPHLAPWRIGPHVHEAKAVLEVPSGRCLLQEGQRLGVELPSGVRRSALASSLIVAGSAVLSPSGRR
jgi:hypothetical protein